jgi:hypothetical protein
LLAIGRWFSPSPPASSTTKTGRHDIAEILLKVALKHQKIKSLIEFKYLGILISRTGSFSKAKKANVNKTTRATYDIIMNGRLHNLSIECQLNLFDKIVKLILLYGCEVWGVGSNDIVERVHLKFCKIILHVKKSSP